MKFLRIKMFGKFQQTQDIVKQRGREERLPNLASRAGAKNDGKELSVI